VSLTKPERETVITMSDDSASAEVYTCQRTIITKLRRAGATLVEDGTFQGTHWARFTMPARFLSFRTVR
jgi:hypothetical protein